MGDGSGQQATFSEEEAKAIIIEQDNIGKLYWEENAQIIYVV